MLLAERWHTLFAEGSFLNQYPKTMVKQLLEQLRQKMAGSPNFSQTMNFFMDTVAPLPAFLEEGELSAPDPKIRAVLEATLQAALKSKKFKLQYSEDIRHPVHQFSHGPFLFSGNVGLYFFFHDIGQGLAMFQGAGGQTLCARISATAVPKGNWADLSTYDKTSN